MEVFDISQEDLAYLLSSFADIRNASENPIKAVYALPKHHPRKKCMQNPSVLKGMAHTQVIIVLM